MHSASNLKLTQSGKTECTLPELKAYLGTEILASVLGIKRLSHMWSTNLYIGNPGILSTISRNRFDEIRQTVVTYVDHDYRSKSADPLWTLRSIMKMFLVHLTFLDVLLCFAIFQTFHRFRCQLYFFLPHKDHIYK